MSVITIEGAIAAGKTSLTELLSERLQSQPFYEPVSDNPVLPLFYDGNKQVASGKWKTNPYAFLLQIFFLNSRFKMIKKAFQNENNVLDRSIYTDAIFCKMNYERGNMTKVEWETYHDLLNNMMEELPDAAHKKAPDLMIVIKVSYDTMLKRIKLRGRDYELPKQDQGLKDYYGDLLRRYNDFIKNYQISPLLVLDGDRYDFVYSKADRQAVLKQIYQKIYALHKLSSTEYKRLLKEGMD